MLRSETAASPERMATALAGLRRYQEAERKPLPEPMPAIAERRGAVLRDYGGSGAPVLFIPSLINPPRVLDLPGASLLGWLSAQGCRVLLLDWGEPVSARRGLSVTGHVEEVIAPLIEAAGEPPALVGYCLGGTMAAAAAQIAPARALATIAAPWRFGGYAAEERERLAAMWRDAAPVATEMGVLPMEALQCLFWSLDPARTVSKFEQLADTASGSAEEQRFVALEDWANDGPPLVAEAARELFEGFIRGDLPGRRAWTVGGARIDPARLRIPLLNIASTTDRIVPHASAIDVGERIDLALGHVGMVIGGRARQALWEPLAAWLSRVGGA